MRILFIAFFTFIGCVLAYVGTGRFDFFGTLMFGAAFGGVALIFSGK